WGDAEMVGEFTDSAGGGGGVVRGGAGPGGQMTDRLTHRVEGFAVAQQLVVAAVDELQGGVEPALVYLGHDPSGEGVAVCGDQGEVGAQRRGVRFGVDAVTADGAFGGGNEPVAFVVPDGLGGESVLAGEVGRAKSAHLFRLYSTVPR